MTMREILFRGKHKSSGKWCEGNLHIDKRDVAIITPDDTPLGCYGQVDPDTVGQFAGLTDKNGKKIFEGDIVKIDIAGLIFNAVCKFHSGSFGLVWNYMGADRWQAFTSICHVEYEVIGNIHDNQELIGGERHG